MCWPPAPDERNTCISMSASSMSMSHVALVQHRHDRQRGERGLPLALRVERAHAHEPVHAALGLQPAVRVAALDDELDRRQAGLGCRASSPPPRRRSRAAAPSARTCGRASRSSPARRRRPRPTTACTARRTRRARPRTATAARARRGVRRRRRARARPRASAIRRPLHARARRASRHRRPAASATSYSSMSADGRRRARR